MKNLFVLLFLLAFVSVNCFGEQNIKQHIKDQIERTENLKSTAFDYVDMVSNQPNLKSTLAKNKMLDKITYPNGSYKTFAYNEAGLLIDYKFFNYDSFSEELELQEHQEMEYDGDGNRTLFIDRNLDSFEGFIIVEKIEASYQDNNIPKEEIYSEYSEAESELIVTGKTLYTLSNENLLSAESFSWNNSTGEWSLKSKNEVEFTNYAQPNSIKTLEFDGASDSFVVVAAMEFTYNANGQVAEMITKYISEDTGEFVVASTTVSTYDDDGNILSETENGSYMGTTVVAYEQLYTYEDGLLIKEEYNGMFGSTYTEYSYDGGKLSEKRDFYEEYDDDYVVTGFSMQYKDQFFYNNTISVDELVYPADFDTYYSSFADFVDPQYFKYGALDYTICASWDYVSESVIEKYRGIYHYSDFEAGVINETGFNDFVSTSVKIGPNPCSDIINIFVADESTVDVKIFNSAGKLMMKEIISSNFAINTSLWEKGIYIVTTPFESYKLFKK